MTMKIENLPFHKIDWAQLAAAEAAGDTRTSFDKTFDAGAFKCRLVDYKPGYLADHWCGKGHIFLMLSGEAVLVFKTGAAVTLTATQGFCVEDGAEPHRIRSDHGATAYIID